MSEPQTEIEAIEAILEADWHKEQCGCDGWPGNCLGLERPFPPFTWTVDAVIAAQLTRSGVTDGE